MGCGTDPFADAEECAVAHWSPALVALNSHRERNGQWRADCPVPDCGAERSLEYDAPGKHVRWRSFCGRHDKEAVRPHLEKLVGPCMPRGARQREAVRHEELIELVLADLPPQSLRLGLLEMAGMGTAEALEKLGVGPTHKRRAIEPLRRLGKLPAPVSPRRSLPLPVSVRKLATGLPGRVSRRR
jgi:hypothetical protein